MSGRGPRGDGTEPPDRPRRVDDRAVVPSIGKALEASLVLLYVALLSTALYGGFVPDYRATAGDELADRTLASAAHEVRSAVPPSASDTRVRRSVDLPETIRGEGYRVRAVNGSLVLDHPDGAIGARARLALPARVQRVEGEWHSRRETRVLVTPAPGPGDGVVVRLVSGPLDTRLRAGGGGSR